MLTIEQVLEKAMKNNVPEGHCYHCGKPINNYRKREKFCSGNCKYDFQKYNVKKTKFRSHKYMFIWLGTWVGGRGQGKRGNGMIKGSMSAYQDNWSSPQPVTRENIERNLCSDTKGINLCTNVWLTKEEAFMLADYLESKESEG